MKDLTGLIGREALVEKALKEIKKGRHLLLTGSVGVGKSALLETLLERLERRKTERVPIDVESDALSGDASSNTLLVFGVILFTSTTKFSLQPREVIMAATF
ncbi:MAG: type IV secretion system DNA-binding domain-containing protein [Gammaproteobacteria bacterium]|nr:type IV secretion system DNA-binding domain-containing protein [Gammaproteobacteria bacterium]